MVTIIIIITIRTIILVWTNFEFVNYYNQNKFINVCTLNKKKIKKISIEIKRM